MYLAADAQRASYHAKSNDVERDNSGEPGGLQTGEVLIGRISNNHALSHPN